MFTSENPETLAAALSRMTLEPVPVEKAEELLSEYMSWLPTSEPVQGIAEERILEIRRSDGAVHPVRRRTIVFRREGDRLQIMVEVAPLGADGIDLERRRFDEASDEPDRYIEELRTKSAPTAARPAQGQA